MCEYLNVYYYSYRYKDGTSTDDVYLWLWQALESYSNEERMLFLRFVSGQSRLPTRVSDISQRFQLSKGGRVRDTLLNIVRPQTYPD